jgi:hypothetical protein
MTNKITLKGLGPKEAELVARLTYEKKTPEKTIISDILPCSIIMDSLISFFRLSMPSTLPSFGPVLSAALHSNS